MSDLDAIKRILERERRARKEAESILEKKSYELYILNKELKELNENDKKAVLVELIKNLMNE